MPKPNVYVILSCKESQTNRVEKQFLTHSSVLTDDYFQEICKEAFDVEGPYTYDCFEIAYALPQLRIMRDDSNDVWEWETGYETYIEELDDVVVTLYECGYASTSDQAYVEALESLNKLILEEED